MQQRVLRFLCHFCSLFLSYSTFGVAAEDTVLKLYRPYGEAVDQIVPVVKQTVTGQCTGPSQRVVRKDAWRCLASGRVFDPCFAQEDPRQLSVICPSSPWSADSVQIALSARLNSEGHHELDMSRTFPWAIELVNGEYCQAVDPGTFYDSMPIRYHCTMDNDLVGYLQRCKAIWSMLETTPHGVITVDLKKAWF